MVDVMVTVGESRFELAPGETLTFGRDASCAVCLDPEDLGISRLAGSVEEKDGTWWVFNRSSVRPLEAVDEIGIRTIVAPGRRLAVVGPLTVVVEGSVRRHALRVLTSPPEGSMPRPPAPPGDVRPTVTAADVIINDQDRLALAALFSGYLESFPRYDPHPRSGASRRRHPGLAAYHAGQAHRVPPHPVKQRRCPEPPGRERPLRPGGMGPRHSHAHPR